MSTAADSQESGSPPPSPTDSATSESAPTLVHIKQEMPPAADSKDYFGAIDYTPDTYLPQNLPEYGRYLSRPIDFKYQEEKTDLKDDFREADYSTDYNMPSELVMKGGGIFARMNISIGTKYGPFIGRWETQPLDRRFAWEVSLFYFLRYRP